MQTKLLYALVEELSGEGSGKIVEILFNKKDVNEFNISTQMNLTINQVRNILYKLSNFGLVSFIRKKDKRKGWYIYYWTLNTEKCLIKLQQSLIEKIKELESLLAKRGNERFYVCPSCGIEVDEEKALEHGFTCEECAEVYKLVDNSNYIRDTKAKITKTQKELELIEVELNIIKEADKKKRARTTKREEKKTKIIKEKLKKERAVAKIKLLKQEARQKKKLEKKKQEKKSNKSKPAKKDKKAIKKNKKKKR